MRLPYVRSFGPEDCGGENPVKTALIGGIGNVLLGDDGVGPYVVHHLESQYSFAGNVEVADLGTPALDLTHRIVGRELVILIDSVSTDDPPGTVLAYGKEDILSVMPAQRLDPHSPALSECLLAAEMLGASPENVLLVGIVSESFEPGRALSEPVQMAVDKVINVVLEELTKQGFEFAKRTQPIEPRIWWTEPPALAPFTFS